VPRFPVPDDKVPWEVPYPEYKATNYTAKSVADQPVWADLDYSKGLADKTPARWNQIDGKVDRRSHMGNYTIQNNIPINPKGRTGLTGRGCLGKWGPNHAADPIVTRWKRDNKGNKILEGTPPSQKPVLQFIAIQRADSGEWAIPGGMIDAGERLSVTLKREFSEEAMNSLDATPAEKAAIEANITDLFRKGEEVYRGYVDDPRNTDNCWMETVAVNFHDETGDSVGKFNLHAGDDAVGVRWTDINSQLKLFASHVEFVKKVAELRNAYW